MNDFDRLRELIGRKDKENSKDLIILLSVFLTPVYYLLLALAFKTSWNYFAIDFYLPVISFWKSFAILVASKILLPGLCQIRWGK